MGDRARRSRQRCAQGEGAGPLRSVRTAKGLGPLPLHRRGLKIRISMRERTPLSRHRSTVERGREAPMVISPLRLARLLVGIARRIRADLRRSSRHD
jgi:hypothetical protein